MVANHYIIKKIKNLVMPPEGIDKKSIDIIYIINLLFLSTLIFENKN